MREEGRKMGNATKSVVKFLGTMARAILAGAIAFGTGLTAVLGEQTTIGGLTQGQWATICVGAVIAFGAVWGVTNAKPGAKPDAK
jgi:hypothetical protein